MRYNTDMKTVFLMRHAKSAWDNPEWADIDRPLAARGLEDAPRMARLLMHPKWMPDAIISSPARRARETAQLVADTLNLDIPIHIENRLYPGSSADFFGLLRSLPDTLTHPLLVAHNPAIENSAGSLAQSIPNGKIRIPTAGLLRFDVDIEHWLSLSAGMGILRWFVIPKLIKPFIE